MLGTYMTAASTILDEDRPKNSDQERSERG